MKNFVSRLLRSRRKTPWLMGAAALLAATLLPPAWRWLRDDDALPGQGQSDSGPAIEARNVGSIIASENGQRVAEFAAARVEISSDRRFATATNVTNGVLYRDGKPFLWLRAGRVKFNQQTRDWEADGNLHASGPNAFAIASQSAQWTQGKSELRCSGPVQATYRGARISSTGTVYNAKDGTLSCPQPLEVRSKAVTIQSPKATAYIKERRVESQSGVQITVHPNELAPRR